MVILWVYSLRHNVIIQLSRGQGSWQKAQLPDGIISYYFPYAVLTKGLPMAKKILIMDDDPTIADLLREALADEGYETYMTTQSLRFYDAVREHQPDLILLDLMMQYLDGRDELKLLQLGEEKIPVIVVTAYLDAGNEEEEFREAGVVHIVYKPFDLDKLLDLVKSTIGEPEGKSA